MLGIHSLGDPTLAESWSCTPPFLDAILLCLLAVFFRSDSALVFSLDPVLALLPFSFESPFVVVFSLLSFFFCFSCDRSFPFSALFSLPGFFTRLSAVFLGCSFDLSVDSDDDAAETEAAFVNALFWKKSTCPQYGQLQLNHCSCSHEPWNVNLLKQACARYSSLLFVLHKGLLSNLIQKAI